MAPHRFPEIYRRAGRATRQGHGKSALPPTDSFSVSDMLHKFGDRHISHAAHQFIPPLEFKMSNCDQATFASSNDVRGNNQLIFRSVDSDTVRLMPGCGVAALQPLFDIDSQDGPDAAIPFDIDTDGIRINEDLIICGLEVDRAREERNTNADLSVAEMAREPVVPLSPCVVHCRAVARYRNQIFQGGVGSRGNVLIASVSSDAAPQIALGKRAVLGPNMSGGPVIRASNGKVVGVFIAETCRQVAGNAADRSIDAFRHDTSFHRYDGSDTPNHDSSVATDDRDSESHEFTAVIDISGEPDILEKVPGHGAAFVPIKEFLEALRQVETER